MFKRLFAIAVLGAALVACTPAGGGSGSSPNAEPSMAVPTDVMPSNDMMSAEPSDGAMPSP